MINVKEIKNSTIKIIPTFACNLACSHCDVKHNVEKYKFNEEKFFNVFDQLDASNSIAFFGGEPLINDIKVFNRILDSNKITAMTSNFLLLTEQHLDKLIEKHVLLGTSWNPDRFNANTYKIWKKNIQLVKSKHYHLEVFITLTDSLFDNMDDFFKVLNDLNNLHVDTLTLSMLIPANKKLVEMSDNLLCWLEDNWQWSFKNRIKTDLIKFFQKHRKSHGKCSDQGWILYPNGQLEHTCSHTKSPLQKDFEECKTCIYGTFCAKCPRQPCCTFLKKYFFKLVKKYNLFNFNNLNDII